MNYHNPENLTEWGQADGWRLLTTEEAEKPLPDDAEFFDCDEWHGAAKNRISHWTYRTRKPLPVSPPIAQRDADIKAKQELREIALAVEAGAEWEVDSGTGTGWHKPDYEFAWYFREDRACAWQVRLKPKPVTRPMQARARLAKKEKEVEQAAFSDGLELRGIIRQIGEMFRESQTPRTDAAESDQEDRAEYRGHLVPACFARELESELTELAAEKEKEVAELRKALEVEIAERDRLREQLKFSADDNLLDEAKRVLGLVNYGEHDNPNDEGNGPCLCLQCQFVRAKRQLLTRLGGSHE